MLSLTSASTATRRAGRALVASGSPSTRSTAQPVASPGETSIRRSTSLRTPEPMERHTGFLNWMFRSRRTGRISLAQLPNWQLVLWLVASAVIRLGNPQGWARDVLAVIASAALALWAGDEVLRGVNPFRRILGGAVLAWLVFSLVRPG